MRIKAIVISAALCGLAPAAWAGDAELSGTSWRLVEIRSMDDSVYTPEEGASYSLTLGDDGRAAIEAGCNRGSGSWASEQAGNLTFGPIASTRAACPPDSISERYLAQFEWVRSYVLRDGRLFLATMADGSIIEFEPASATVLGEWIFAGDAAELQDRVLRPLFDAYAEARSLSATEDEIDQFIEQMNRGMKEAGLDSADELTAEEAAEVDAMRREMGRSIITQWKINKSLQETYGGRIAYQQMGPEPIDAYRAFLEERQKAGDFSILNQELGEAFWSYFSDDARHDFMPAGSEDEANAFATPPWEDA